MSDPLRIALSCVSSHLQLCAQNCDHLPPPPPPNPYMIEPPTHTFLKRPFLTDFKKHTNPPPYGTKFWSIGRKLEMSPKICEFTPCWQEPDFPERYCTSLGDGGHCSNLVGFWWSSSLLCYLCPLCVP